jgi:hypothetical protein
MARMDDDVQQPVGRCGTSIHPQKDRQTDVIDLTVKQAMASSNYATYSKQLQLVSKSRNVTTTTIPRLKTTLSE